MVLDKISNAFGEISKFLSDNSQFLVDNPLFQQLGLVVLFLWMAIPSSVPVSEFITFPLHALGVSPIALVLVATTGAVTGNYILYMLGRSAHRVIRRKHKDKVDAGHLLHKYKLPIFLAVPFLFFIGDIIVIIAGFERIGFKNMLPFLLVGELIRQTLGIFAVMGLVKLPEFLGLQII